MSRRFGSFALVATFVGSVAFLATIVAAPSLFGQEKALSEAASGSESPESDVPDEAAPAADPAAPQAAPKEGLIPINRKGTVRIDRKRKLVVIDGRIALRAGQLEMFACPAGTKEHESVVAVDTDSSTVHTALLAVGAVPGAVVKFDPAYTAAYGDVLEVYVVWKDEQGKPHQVRGQSWVRDAKTNDELKSDWVFGGSGFWTDPADGKTYYYADGGELICVSNFPTAMMDLPIKSSQANDSLLFEAFTERIPARGTPVRLVLRIPPNPDYPRDVTQTPGAGEPASASAESDPGAPAPESEPSPPAESTPPADDASATPAESSEPPASDVAAAVSTDLEAQRSDCGSGTASTGARRNAGRISGAAVTTPPVF